MLKKKKKNGDAAASSCVCTFTCQRDTDQKKFCVSLMVCLVSRLLRLLKRPVSGSKVTRRNWSRSIQKYKITVEGFYG